MIRKLGAAALSLSVALVSLDSHAASLQGTGLDLVRGLSGDGSTAVGYVTVTTQSGLSNQPYRWTAPTGATSLGSLDGYLDGLAFAASADGAIVVGEVVGESGTEAFRWTSATGMIGLGAPTATLPDARDVSRDGTVVVGSAVWDVPGFDYPVFQAARWTGDGLISPLGFLDGTVPWADSGATATSADGSVVVGWSSATNAELEAFRWTESGGMVGLGFLHPGIDGEMGRWSEAFDVSADGSIVVGSSLNAVGIEEAFLWTASGILGLGFSDLADSLQGSIATAISGDGSIVVGSSGGDAMIWDAEHGMRDLADVLVNELGLDLGGWVLGAAMGISDDGQTIVGNGLNPQGEYEGWIVHLVPEPSGASLAGLAAFALAALRRRAIRA